jgi:hypothetical protein
MLIRAHDDRRALEAVYRASASGAVYVVELRLDGFGGRTADVLPFADHSSDEAVDVLAAEAGLHRNMGASYRRF